VTHPRTDQMAELAAWIERHADQPLTLEQLARRASLSPAHLQRVFRDAIGVSPLEYQRGIRNRVLKEKLRDGGDVAGAVFEAGFGSVSRVYESLDRHLGMTPSGYRRGGYDERVDFALRTTALGSLIMAATARGVCHVHFGDDSESLESALRDEFPRADLRRSAGEGDAMLDDWMTALATHIDGGGPRPELPLHVFGTALQIATWRFLTSLGDRELRSYGEVASAIDRPRAVRAVASACAANNIAVLIPCHRVLRKDGGVGGYRWGLARKQALLAASASN